MGLVAGWQIFILVTLVIARVFSASAMVKLALFWTVWTLVMLFMGPLVLLQLATIWVPVMVLVRDRSEPIPVQRPPEKVVPPGTAEKQTTPNPPTLLNEMVVAAEMAAKAATAFREKSEYRLKYSQRFMAQTALIKASLKRAEERAALERELDADPALRAAYGPVRAGMVDRHGCVAQIG